MATDKTGPRPQSAWPAILCLIGLDYFSSLGYQPSNAFAAAGLAAPLATLVVVLVTLGGALPVYAYVTSRSPHGQGATGVLERAVHGWIGKLLILVLLGFAATDFVVTRTLSTADAAEHLIHNPARRWQATLDSLSTTDENVRQLLASPFWQMALGYWNRQLVVTLILSILAFGFWAIFRHGFTRRVIQLAVVVVSVYLVLTAVVIVSGLVHLAGHPELLRAWWQELLEGTDRPYAGLLAPGHLWSVVVLCLLAFPRMSLGLSGFELSMVVMPLIRGDSTDPEHELRGRIRNTRKLLLAAAGIMSLYLLGSSLVTTLLIPTEALNPPGEASNRALAYLAHGGGIAPLNPLFGETFGSVYDVSTILILCLAGASVTIGLRDLVPRYLHRLGMEFDWAHRVGAILHIFNVVNLVITVLFQASVTAQMGAYATSVLVLLSSAAGAAVVDYWRRRSGRWFRRLSWPFALIGAFFLVSATAAILTKPDGLLIALCFVLAIVVTSVLSRALRCTELRFEGFRFKDANSQFLWESLKPLDFPVLVPHRPGQHSLLDKEQQIRQKHRLPPAEAVVFVEAELGDASDFYHQPLLEATQEEGRFILRITGCASIAHVLAAVGLELSRFSKPPEIHFGWSDESPIAANINFLLFGQGNVPWMVHELIRRAEPDPERRPGVIIG
jgi:hypothetical protein